MGDLNFPEYNGADRNCENKNHNSKDINISQAAIIYHLSDRLLWEQMVTEPTRGKNYLDLIFHNNEDIFLKSDVEINKTLSDHNTVTITLGEENSFEPIDITKIETEKDKGEDSSIPTDIDRKNATED